MKKTRVLKTIIMISLVGSSLVMSMLPLLRVASQDISLFGVVKLYLDNKDKADLLTEWIPEIENHVTNYMIPVVILLVLPFIEAVVIGAIKNTIVFYCAIGSVGINAVSSITIITFMYGKFGEATETANGLLSFWGEDIQIRVVKSTLVLLFFLYAAILIVAGYGIFGERIRALNQLQHKEIYSENISPKVNLDNLYLKNCQVSKDVKHVSEGNSILDDMIKKQNGHQPVKDGIGSFYGALVGRNSIYQNRIFTLNECETLTIGKKGAYIVFGETQSDMLALLSFDKERQEYLVKSLYKNTVFLKSGQPLGADRVYHIPRGMDIYILDRKDMFELA